MIPEIPKIPIRFLRSQWDSRDSRVLEFWVFRIMARFTDSNVISKILMRFERFYKDSRDSKDSKKILRILIRFQRFQRFQRDSRDSDKISMIPIRF